VGLVSRELLLGLYRDATVVAYVPLAEGWGLPPVEALNVGTRVVASATTPSVASNERVVRVDPLDVESIAEGLLAALREGDDYEVKPLDVNRWPISRGATSPSITWWRGDETALDVSAVPRGLAGAGRYIGELARRVPATGVETTWSRAETTPCAGTTGRRRRTSPRSSQRPAHSKLLYEGVGGRSQFDGAIG